MYKYYKQIQSQLGLDQLVWLKLNQPYIVHVHSIELQLKGNCILLAPLQFTSSLEFTFNCNSLTATKALST